MARLDSLTASTEREILGAIDRQAAALSRDIARILGRMSRRAETAVLEGRDPAQAVLGVSGEMARALTARLAYVADVGANQVVRLVGELETKDAETFRAGRLDWARGHAARKVKQVSDTTRELIRRRVERAVSRNMPPRELAKDLRDRLGGRVARARADRIARTELHQAANVGQFEEAQRISRGGTRMVKVWRSTRDHRTRRSHRMADGQVRPIDQPFVVGGVPLMHPGDPNGPAKEVINCRCVQTLVPEKVAAASGAPTVSETARGGLRARLGEAEARTALRGQLQEIERGGELGPKSASRLFESLARETMARRQVLAAPRTMTAVERAAFERLGNRRALQLLMDADLPAGAITAHPQPPMILRAIIEIDDQILFRDLIVMLTDTGEVVPS